LHQRRRIALGQPGCFASDRFGEFHREVASELLAAGQLRLFWLELDGSPVAAEYQLAGGGVTYAYQAGVDPLRIDEEPGRLITIATLQHAIAEGQQAFDFLRGDEPYKAHWRAEPRQTHSYRVAAGSRAARIRHHAWTAADGMRDWLKTGIAALTGSTS
jgi:CelD/BcsL family acetyltransferase involved in cellulose biosynthesis